MARVTCFLLISNVKRGKREGSKKKKKEFRKGRGTNCAFPILFLFFWSPSQHVLCQTHTHTQKSTYSTQTATMSAASTDSPAWGKLILIGVHSAAASFYFIPAGMSNHGSIHTHTCTCSICMKHMPIQSGRSSSITSLCFSTVEPFSIGEGTTFLFICYISLSLPIIVIGTHPGAPYRFICTQRLLVKLKKNSLYSGVRLQIISFSIPGS